MLNLPINSANINLVVIFALFQGFLVLLIVFLFIDKFFSTRKYRVEQNKVKAEAFKQAQEALNTAQVQANATILSAQNRAQELLQIAQKDSAVLISNTDLFSTQLKEQFAKSILDTLKSNEHNLTQIAEEIGNDLKTTFKAEKVSTIAGFTGVIDTLNAEARSQIEKYKDLVANNSVKLEDELRAQSLVYLQEIKRKMDAYDRDHRERLKGESLQILSALCMKFFGSTNSVKDNETLVLKILEDLQKAESTYLTGAKET